MSVDIGSRRCERSWQGPGNSPAIRLPLLPLLGPLSVIGSRSGLQLLYRKGWALLAYLLVEQGRNHRRTELSALLWPRLSETAALTNLRQVLCDLKRKLAPLLGPDQLQIEREWVRLRLDPLSPVSDLQQVQAMVIDHHRVADPRQLGWLLECSELLEGWEPDGSEEFNFWLATTRQWYQLQWLRALDRLRSAAQRAGDWRLALDCVRCQIRADPWNETLHRQRMTLYSAMGEAALALASYRELEAVLKRELGVDPQRETIELAGAIGQQAGLA